MLKEKDTVVRRLMMALDMAVIAAAFLAAYFLRTEIRFFYALDFFPMTTVIGAPPGHFSQYALFWIFAAPLWCYLLHRSGSYRSWRLWKTRSLAWIVIKSSLLALLILGAALFLFKFAFMSRLFIVMFIVLGVLFLIAEKITIFAILHALRRRGYNYRQILMVGTGRRAEEFIRRIHSRPEWGLRIIGAVEDEPGRGVERVDGVKVIGDLKDIGSILRHESVDQVAIVVPRMRLQSVENAIRECETEGVEVIVAVDLFNLKIAKLRQKEIDGIPLLTCKTVVPDEWQLLIKRIMDIVISGLLIIFLSPILLVIAILIKATSPGPVLFRQERVGLNKRRFTISKFRTMVAEAQKTLSRVDIYQEIYSPEWKGRKMELVTPVGKLLRKFSLDELPQFFNVLLGHMSLVGPRPTLPDEVQQYESWHRRRFSMRPGLTCLWQVNGRREIKFNEWMQMDLEYLDHWSLWLDIKILVKTVPAIFLGTGAY